MRLSLRGWSVLVVAAGVLGALVLGAARLPAADTPASGTGELSEQSLGTLLSSLGLKTKKEQQRYDFTFEAVHQGNKWELSMSAVLSQNGETVWLMAWLDELPMTASDVPRAKLLQLLALNDVLGEGKFFAYVTGNRRFILERVIPNRAVNAADFRAALQDLGSSVVQTYAYWNVENWKETSTATATEDPSRTTPAAPATQSRRLPTASAVNDSKFQDPQKR